MISFYTLSKIFFLKREILSDKRLVSIAKKGYGFAVNILYRFITFLKSISDERYNLLKFAFSWNFHNKIVNGIISIFFATQNKIV